MEHSDSGASVNPYRQQENPGDACGLVNQGNSLIRETHSRDFLTEKAIFKRSLSPPQFTLTMSFLLFLSLCASEKPSSGALLLFIEACQIERRRKKKTYESDRERKNLYMNLCMKEDTYILYVYTMRFNMEYVLFVMMEAQINRFFENVRG